MEGELDIALYAEEKPLLEQAPQAYFQRPVERPTGKIQYLPPQ